MTLLKRLAEIAKAIVAAMATGVAVELGTSVDDLRKAIVAGAIAGLLTYLVPNGKPKRVDDLVAQAYERGYSAALDRVPSVLDDEH